ncbi:uncharacterized protein LY89DRAFT_228965 [Mollisia scopiformis]|uniref:Uncharacterized protein n=1 Tax=Mollisia scopiformis TaxID=149040 RepID=A0A194WVM8_MOLSC|nr:uncharacterized protein LY89DRAFT_228965 [Mollisia scopiformis]KUJ11642.1 hypothetical protein LY89DRAFT_228965 [Mollisia scopiformis]
MDYLSDRSDPDNDIDNIPPEEEFIDSTDSTDGEDGDNVSDWDRGRVSEAHNTIILERQEELPRSIDSLFKKGLLDKKGEMGSTILHLITERWSKTNRSGSDLAELFKAVMEKCPRLFLEKDDLGKSILNRSSMRKKKSNFAQFFIYEYPDKTEELVREDPDILKLMVASSMELDIWKALLGRLGKSAGKLLLRCDEGGNTFIHNILRNIDHGPFHVALPHIILEIIRAAPDSLKTLNDEGKSLYGCFIEGMNKRTESSELRMRKESALPASHDSRTMTEKSSRLSEKYFDGPKISPTGKIFDNPKMDNPPSRRPEKYSDDPKMNISSSRLLPDPKDNAKSAAQTSQPVVRKRAKEPKPEETEELVNHILAEVKEVLLREMYRGLGEMEIHSLLHPYTSEIDVDLLELEKSRDPIQTLKGILEPLPLEPFLRSVRLPYFRTDLAARTDIYFEILGTLNSHGVRRIMRLEVDEAIDCPSSDDTITKAASGFHIEEWDWRKTDIDTGVLCKVAPEARKLYLYSSGNFPVLKHWSSDEGLAMFKNLEEVSLIVFSKIETPQTTEDCVREFRMRMDKACPKIEFKVRHFKPSFEGSRSWSWLLQGDQGRLIETAKGPNPKTLTERFERLTRHLEPCFDKPSIDVKVSIIDDGIDPVEIGNRIGGGISFAHYPGEHSRLKPYYFSSNGRGTALAHIMLRLCAQLKFYVARVDIEQRSLTPIVQVSTYQPQ